MTRGNFGGIRSVLDSDVKRILPRNSRVGRVSSSGLPKKRNQDITIKRMRDVPVRRFADINF